MVRTNLLIPTYVPMLGALRGWLEKPRSERWDKAPVGFAAASR